MYCQHEILEITEIKRRLDISAGVTEPFVCQCSDGNEYYVKGRYAGYQEMIRELVSAEIASRLGLPVPPFSIARLPCWKTPRDKADMAADIGEGPVFASKAVPLAMRYQGNPMGKPGMKLSFRLDETAMRIALFDWWIRNPDRSIENPNMLISQERLFIIDHNMAFTGDETLQDFKRRHVFGEFIDLNFVMAREHSELEFDSVLSAWNDICEMIPCQWLESCHDGAGEVAGMLQTLKRYRNDPNGFWTL